jgi:hypothetical protein
MRSPKCTWQYQGEGPRCGRTEKWHLLNKPTVQRYWHTFEIDLDDPDAEPEESETEEG